METWATRGRRRTSSSEPSRWKKETLRGEALRGRDYVDQPGQRLRKAGRPQEEGTSSSVLSRLTNDTTGGITLRSREILFFLALVHGALGDRGNEARFFFKVLPIFERHFGMHHEYRGLGGEGSQRSRRTAHRSRSAESRAMRGLFHFSIVFLGGERKTSAPRGVCAGCTGCSVISFQRWFDRVIPSKLRGC